MKAFHLKILAAEGLFYEGECESLILPISDGHYGILADHQNTCAAIKPGTLEFTVPEEGKRYDSGHYRGTSRRRGNQQKAPGRGGRVRREDAAAEHQGI